MASPEQFVVGIDLGTTYSAVAWALVSDPKNIEVLTDWPTSGQIVGVKVPTEISYADDGTVTWGYDINVKTRKIKWFKLGLEEAVEAQHLLQGKDPVHIARDYLKELLKNVKHVLKKRYSTPVIDAAKFEFVLTVPAIWSDIAKQRTQAAAFLAGLGTADAPLELLSEPESAALYSLKTIDKVLETIKVGDRIVVCDAGGGTVDLISYDLQQIEPYLKVVECTQGTGDFCGSVFIDREFEKFFKSRIGEDLYDKIPITHRQQVVKEFEGCKQAFRDDAATKVFSIRMPNTVPDSPQVGIEGGVFELTRENMRGIFDPVIQMVMELIEDQISMASVDGKVNMILLVGGFGQSQYLYLRISEWAKQSGIQVIQPKESAIAVVKGAVLKGIEKRSFIGHTKVVRRARRSYGVPSKAKFEKGKHSEKDAEYDPSTGELLAANQVRWFIFANQLIDDDDIFRYAFQRTFETLTVWQDNLVSSHLANPPSHMTPDVQKHCTIYSNLTHLKRTDFDKQVRGRTVYYSAEYEIVLSLKNNNLNFSLLYRGTSYGVADIAFEEIK